MKDYAQYSSRIPSPKFKRSPGSGGTPTKGSGVATTTTRNVTSHPLSSPEKKNGYSTPPDKREKDSVSTASTSQGSMPSRQPSPSTGIPQQHLSSNKNRSSPYSSSTNLDHAEVTIHRLKEQLGEAVARDATAKAALSKSDQVILDLRSDQRQLKRQLENLRQEKAEWNKNVKVAQVAADRAMKDGNAPQQQRQIQDLKSHIQHLTEQLQRSAVANHNTNGPDLSKDAKVGELQVQLDRAHAQILTADMVRKELEDTLEAEQYTWDLRAQDQEREIVALQRECETLAQDLEQCRAQWKEAERGWNDELEELRAELTQVQARLATASASNSKGGDHESLMKKIHQLETERAELQSCLDEALKELEAVDAELQTEDGSKLNGGNKSTVESLQHLLRWIYQEGPVEKRFNTSQLSEQTNTKELVSQIQEALEGWLSHVTTSQSRSIDKNASDSKSNVAEEQEAVISELQEQIKAHQETLKTREESSGELRESLKEAVALLKPLQDAVAQAEEEKSQLQQQLTDLEKDRRSSQEEITQQSKEMEFLREQMTSLEEQLEEQKRLSRARESLLEAATPSPHKSRSLMSTPQPPDSEDSLAKIKRAREELRRKRETEGNLQQLLKDAQSRFKNLHQQNESVAAQNRELQGQIQKLDGGDSAPDAKEAELSATLAQREAELQAMREQLERVQRSVQDDSSNATTSFQRIKSLEEDLTRSKGELAQREQAERVLNKSLKEALGLLKPLQMHLEEAEQEKIDISKELRNLRKRFRQLQMGEGDDLSRSTMGTLQPDVSVELIKIKDELEETVRQLEMENSQLHDALEDLTEDGQMHNEAKLRQRLVELNSRYEVTQNKLEDAHVENHALVKALKQRETEEMQRKDEVRQLHEKLRRTENELHNAKSIAKSALVKVEEMTMSNIEDLSRQGPVDMNLDAERMSGFSF
ncbi:MAG: hypothetical protein SGILL_003397 [Bacillariaceae sp.]